MERQGHIHDFLGPGHARAERRAWVVAALTAATMVAEIAAGLVYDSMALLADGLHMATHAGALAVAGVAYAYARRRVGDPRFAYGTGKVGDLAGFASAVGLGIAGAAIGVESALRLAAPAAVRYDEALVVAVLGLVVNLVSALILREGHGHMHDHGHEHDHGVAHGRDHNLRAAYLHVLTDALTSVLAILGLAAGRLWGLGWADPAVGLLGALVILRWSVGLMREAGAVLLDMTPDMALAARMRAALEARGDRVEDLHLWRVGPGHYAASVHLSSAAPEPPAAYKARLAAVASLSHVTVEVNPR